MTEVEWVACSLALGAVVVRLWRGAPRWMVLVPAVAALAVGALIAAGGQWRWQLVPVAVAASMVGLAALASARASGPLGRAVAVAAGVSAVLGFAVCVLFPVRFLPAPTGPFALGTRVFTVVDTTRAEVFTPARGEPRVLPAQIWYPAEPSSGSRDPYVRDAGTFRGLLWYAGAPQFVLDHLAVAPSHAVTDAPAAPGRFPVVVFVSGNLGYRQSNLVQVEDLVSHGHVVVSFDQPGASSSVLLPDGRRIDHPGRAVLEPLVDQSIDPSTPAPTLDGTRWPDGIVGWFTADAAAVLDHVTTLDREGSLAGHLDLDRVGAFGISLGGLEVGQWCAHDARVRACLFMDAPVTADVLARGLDVPALFLTRPRADMNAEGWPSVEVERYHGGQRTLYASTRAPAWYVEVAGLKHADLTDAPFGSPLLQLSGLVGPRAGAETHAIMAGVTTAFFGCVLAGQPTAGVLEAPPWPNITVTHHDGGSCRARP